MKKLIDLEQVVAWIRIAVGLWLFIFSGGILMVILGVIPIAPLGMLAGLLSAGMLSAATLGILTAMGGFYLLVGVPMALYGAALLDSGFEDAFDFSFGIGASVKAGAEKIPVFGQLLGLTIGGE